VNIIQSLFQNTQPPDSPPHVGEAFHIWTYYVEVSESNAVLSFAVNHVTDPELKKLIEDLRSDVLEPQRRKCEEVMKNEGITLAPTSPEATNTTPAEIPPGARMPDGQVAQLTVVKVAGLLQYSNLGLLHSLRDDVGAMFYAFHHQVAAHGLMTKKLLGKKGWLRVPPQYHAGLGKNC